MRDDKVTPLARSADAPPKAGPSGLLAWLPWIAAAVLALLAGFLIEAYFAARTEIVALDEQSALAAIEIKSLQQRIEAERLLSARRIADLSIATQDLYDLGQCAVVPLLSPATGASSPLAVVVWDARRQQGTLVARKLPALAADQSYQLWMVDSRYPSPFGAGGFGGDAAGGEIRFSFKSDRPVAPSAGFVVSVEPKGPALQIAGPVVLSSQ
jgi:anti-sigma-K factor RskA